MPMKNKHKIRKLSGLERAAHSLDFSPQQLKNFVSAGYLPQPKQLDFHAAARLCDRIQGANELRNRLGNVDIGISPSLFIFNRCRRLIECLPNLQNDPKNPEDVLKVNVNEEGFGDHDTYDARRYAVTTQMSGRFAFA